MSSKAGFASIDALVALVLLAGGLALALGAAQGARKAALVAAETRRADALGRYVLAAAPMTPGDDGGRVDGWLWRLAIAKSSEEPALCEARARLTSPSRRVFELATVSPCQAPPP